MTRHHQFFRILFSITLLFIILTSCKNNHPHSNLPLSIYTPQYANGFRILYFNDYKVIETGNCHYYLSKSPEKISLKDSVVIQTPIKNMACMAQSHWAAACILNEMESITGICDSPYIVDSLFQIRFEEGFIKNIAENQTVNYELLLSLQPQLLMLSFDNQQIRNVLQNIGIPVVVNGDFQENHPLGRAEWLIFIAAFYDKEKEAEDFFRKSVWRYNFLKTLISDSLYRPAVFDGAETSGIWYVSGGKSYMAQFYADAGSDYLWKDNDDSGSIPIDFELVYYKGLTADFWRAYLPTAQSYSEIAKEKPLYADLKAWKERHIFYCDNLHTDLFGMGVYQPEVILADFIKIFHPELLPEHQAVYYDFLRKE